MSQQKNRIAVTAIAVGFILASSLRSQDITPPDFYIPVTDGTNLKEKIKLCQDKNKSEFQQRKFWVGYQFDLRDDIDFYEIYIHDEGGISIRRGNGFYLQEEDDLETHALHALGELGDEEAKEKLREKRERFIRDELTDWGVFFLMEGDGSEIDRVKLFSFRGKRKFKDYPVFWLGKIDQDESFSYFRSLTNEGDRKRIVEPAIFIASLHDHPGVIPFLTKLAESDRPVDIRKSATFWLGQIPDEKTLDVLTGLYDREDNREMKEKIIFAISQHKSERSVRKLVDIARKDRDSEMREKAIFWLGQKDSEETLNILQNLLREAESRTVKEKIVFSISQHKSERAAPFLIEVAQSDPDPDVRKKAIFWLGQIAGKRTLQALGDIVESSEETEIKEKAVFAISQHGDREEALNKLIDIAKNNPNPHVRKKAIFWITQTGDERAVDFLKDILTKKD